MYATDASAYRELPQGVLYPKSKEELLQIVAQAAEQGLSLIPRGAGTSLAGQVVGDGVVVDLSRYFNKILEINTEEGWAWIEPGVILDELNLLLASTGLFFAPETSTSNRCTLGGMVGNNSCGSHSLVYGSTRDHLLEAKVILSDGSEAHFKELSKEELNIKLELVGREGQIYRELYALSQQSEILDLIKKEFPDPEVKRRNTGYALDEFFASNFNLAKLLAGSEGTLAIATALKIKLVPLPPKHKMLLCAHCNSLEDAFEANLVALTHNPYAVELMDSTILELSKSNISQNKNRFFVKGEPAAILIIEFMAESLEELSLIANQADRALFESGLVYHSSHVEAADSAKVWALRKAGLGLLTSMPGDIKPVSVIEDTAVAPRKLPAYMAEFKKLLDKYSLECVYHAHIGTGELHLRPLLNLKESSDVELFRQIAFESAQLVKKYGGSLSGEHGDGRLRGEFIPVMYGERLFEVMKGLKKSFDPNSIFNKGKIVDTPPMNSSLRYKAGSAHREFNTYFNYSKEGGWLRAVEQCNGSGDCRKSHLFSGTMCPSFKITAREVDSTRGRANVMRELLTNPQTEKIFDQKEILEALDLCISCKGCKSECPSSVDMARYKAEFMQHHYDVSGTPIRAFLIARMSIIEKIGSIAPSIYNFFISNSFSSSIIKRVMSFSANRNLPTLSKITLRRWAKINQRSLAKSSKKVYLFADEFSNYNEAEIGIAFIELLNAIGYEVIIPKHYESGRAAISKGALKRAKKLALKNFNSLKGLISRESPLVGIEPSAILSFRDEYPDLLPHSLRDEAIALSKNTLLYDEFIMREFERGTFDSSLFKESPLSIILHGHCHQKSLASIEPSAQMLSIPKNYTVKALESGCCGMAGSFGYEKEHYDYSMEIGSQRLFPAIENRERGVVVSAPGTSCRQQIKDGTGVRAYHPIEILRSAIEETL